MTLEGAKRQYAETWSFSHPSSEAVPVTPLILYGRSPVHQLVDIRSLLAEIDKLMKEAG